MKYFFCYQQSMSGIWGPVLFHNDPPNVKHGYEVSSNGLKAATTAPVEIEAEEEPGFAFLKHKFPLENYVNAKTS